MTISTHALREEGDQSWFEMDLIDSISTHALREEGDRGGDCGPNTKADFYPRPPRGGRL